MLPMNQANLIALLQDLRTDSTGIPSQQNFAGATLFNFTFCLSAVSVAILGAK